MYLHSIKTIPFKYYAAMKKNTVFWRNQRALRQPAKVKPALSSMWLFSKNRQKVNLSTILQHFLQFFPTSCNIHLFVLGLSIASSPTCILCNIFRRVLYMIRLLCHCPAEPREAGGIHCAQHWKRTVSHRMWHYVPCATWTEPGESD